MSCCGSGCNGGCGSSRTLFTNNADKPLSTILADAADWPHPEPGSGFMPIMISPNGHRLMVLAQPFDGSAPARWVQYGGNPIELDV